MRVRAVPPKASACCFSVIRQSATVPCNVFRSSSDIWANVDGVAVISSSHPDEPRYPRVPGPQLSSCVRCAPSNPKVVPYRGLGFGLTQEVVFTMLSPGFQGTWLG